MAMLLDGTYFFVVEIENDSFDEESLVNTTIYYFYL